MAFALLVAVQVRDSELVQQELKELELELVQVRQQVRELESDLVLAKARLQVAVSVQQREKE
jgi:cell division protein FtsB